MASKKNRDTERREKETYSENLRTASEAVSEVPTVKRKKGLTNEQIERLADVILSFSQTMCGVSLHDYELEFGWRLIYSILIEDAEEITALFSRQSGKCLAKGTPVMLYTGEVVPVETLEQGDLLMGPDSKPRKILSTCSGTERLWEVVPRVAGHDRYTVNESHILSGVPRKWTSNLIDFPIRDLIARGVEDAGLLGYQASLDFPHMYTSKDPYWWGLNIDRHDRGSYDEGIPRWYLRNDREFRKALLAGLVDSKASKGSENQTTNTCRITVRSLALAKDIQWLTRSLGFCATLSTNSEGSISHTLEFWGSLYSLPIRDPSKKFLDRNMRDDPRAYEFDLIDKGVGEYYGFEIDGDKRFLLGDFTVTHNTETVAVTVCGMLIMLPLLAEKIPGDPRLIKFAKGFWVGIYAPHLHQSGIMFRRMKTRMYSRESKEVLLDPEIDMDLTKKQVIENLRFPNGSFVYCGTAAPQSKIEGDTFHLLICEEAQDIGREVLRSSIHPMAAALAGTLVKIGTVSRERSDFYDACRRNRRSDIVKGETRSRKRKHFEFDYTVAQRNNPRYQKYVEKEIERLGFDSDEFRMKYRLHWLLEKGMFVNPDMFEECGLVEADVLKVHRGVVGARRVIKFPRSSNLVTYDPVTPKVIASIDVGKEFSTVVTIGRPFYEMPIDYAGSTRFPLHIWNWLELQGEDHEIQHEKILSFLANYRISDVIIDATGKGDPVYSRIAADLHSQEIVVVPFIFSASSKDKGYKVLLQEINSKRFTYPAGAAAARTNKWKNFHLQMTDLRKSWRGSTMVVQKDGKSKEARDDYCMSEDMEVLTMEGWRGIDSIDKRSLVACYDPGDSSVKYARPSRIIRRELRYHEYMIHLESDVVDQLVTDNHKLLYERKLHDGRWVSEVGLARSLLSELADRIAIPVGAVRKSRDGKYYVCLPGNRLGRLKRVGQQEYSGRVWCVTVPTGFFLCRRNDKISITGNCDSAMMLNWLVNVGVSMEVEESDNILLGRVARLATAGDIHGAVRSMSNRLKTYRKNMERLTNRRRNSKWD